MPNIYVNPDVVIASNVQNAKTTTTKTKSTAPKKKQEVQTKFELDNGLVVQVLPYKETKPSLSTAYIVNELTEHAVLNGTQTADPAKIALCHLAVITNEVNNIPYESVKTEKNKWAVITSKSITYEINNPLYNAFGFSINKATRTTNFYADNANYSILNNSKLSDVQEMYDSIVAAAVKSNELNSKNNLFTKAHYQQSAFLLELNKVMEKISVSSSIFESDEDDEEEQLIEEIMKAPVSEIEQHICDENCEHNIEEKDDDGVLVVKNNVARIVTDKEEYYTTLI